ncbi:nuclear pore complex protein Nup85-like [Hibiscus syriacus]|uniref:Nuclear pore complex protein Nup85-like n=1 Tax=Hibiscus syriacus TaxID=106335 RepID=A0A6A2X313_HIBSY|nr:nuclear pore complex protein Nup85-like [Hibiscus syriacus]
MPHKVIAVAAGEAHTLALSGDGYVYSWGRGMFGRLGTGSESDELFPVRVKFQDSELKSIAIAAGAYHNLALADSGSVWSWGYNTCILFTVEFVVRFVFEAASLSSTLCALIFGVYLDCHMDGQLGMHGENSLAPQLMERFLELGSPGQSKAELELDSERKSKTSLKICAVKAGGMMSLAIDNLGALWMWGNCPQENSNGDGSLTFESCFTPIPVWDFHGHTVVKVACGNEHVVALVSAGEKHKDDDLVSYTWGGNGHGQLGLGDTENRVRPEMIGTFNQDFQWTVYEVACGAFHTALLTHKKRPSDTVESMCWTFGLGDRGQLGHGTTQTALVPEPVKELPQPIYLVSVDCGLFHTSVVSSAGEVWSWGMEKGLGLCPDASFTGTDSGDAISPADIGGRSGVLGNGKTVDCFTPSVVLWPPLIEDFKQEELNQPDKTVDKKGSDGDSEMEKTLSLAMEEMKLLQSKLSTMERYASMLHSSIFGKPFEERDIPNSLQSSGTFDIAREWERMLESADRSKLVRMEMFYRNMLAGVKDKMMKKRIQEIIKEYLPSSTQGK